MADIPYLPIFETSRGNTAESLHFGAIAVVNSAGELLASFGDPYALTFTRSSAKPLQAIPFVEAGGVKHFDFSAEEVALICSSHTGTREHVAVAESIQSKIGVDSTALLCGTHPPYDKDTRKAMLQRGESPSVNQHDCSGKHSGMLAFAKMQAWPSEDYINPEHPVQQAILKAFAEMVDLPTSDINIGIDGCSAPNFAVPLYNMALGYARLADPSKLPTSRADGCLTITSSMMTHPNMVSGPGRFDTLLMQAGENQILSKGGAEGYQAMAVIPDDGQSPALGIAIKIADGDRAERASSAVALEVLRQLGVVSNQQLESLEQFGPSLPIYNWREIEVGEGHPVFSLSK